MVHKMSSPSRGITICLWVSASLVVFGCVPQSAAPVVTTTGAESPAFLPTPTPAKENVLPYLVGDWTGEEGVTALAVSLDFDRPDAYVLQSANRNLLGVGYFVFLADAIPAKLIFETGLKESEYEGYPDQPWITDGGPWLVGAPSRAVSLASGVEVSVHRYQWNVNGNTPFAQWNFGFEGKDGAVRVAIIAPKSIFSDADVKALVARIR